MKKLRFLAVSILALSIGLGGVNAATSSRSIDKSKCDTVYTNYYFFVDIGSKTYYNQKDLSSYTHNTIAEYHNNSWQISDFDPNNVGFGQVKLGKGTTTSSDGITSMSLNDFWTYKKKAYNTNGAFSDGTKNYVVSHDWYKVTADNQEIKQNSSTSLKNQSVSALVNASLDADITFTRRTSINPNSANPFKIQIFRQFKGYLTGKPLKINNNEQYVQPALYYIQYCSPKQNDPVEPEPEKEFNVRYHGNGSNVTNLPNNQVVKEGKCFTVGNKPSREGYKFLGWSTNSKATTGESKYAPGKEICNLTKDLDLYAIWEEEKTVDPIVELYRVTYKDNANGDTVVSMPSDAEVSIEKDYTISTMIPVRDGYEFLGWSTDSKATVGDDEFKGGSLYQDRKDLVLYAIWKKKETPTPTPDPTPENPENPKTGVTDYLLPFGGTVGMSGLGLQVLKKKKSFKQF